MVIFKSPYKAKLLIKEFGIFGIIHNFLRV